MLKDEIINEIRKEADLGSLLTDEDNYENVISYDKMIRILDKFIPDSIINIFSNENKKN